MSLLDQQNQSPKAKSKANQDPNRNSNNYLSHDSEPVPIILEKKSL